MWKRNEKQKKVIRVTGGIGNQLFQFAFLYSVTKKTGVKFVLDTSSYKTSMLKGKSVHNGYELARVFDIKKDASLLDIIKAGGLRYYVPLAWSKLFKRKLVVKEPVCVETESDYFSYNHRYLDNQYSYYHGFFQNIQYIQDNKSDLKRIFKFPLTQNEVNDSYQKRILESESVSIHVRLGDYGYFEKKNNFRTYGLEYYYAAIEYMQSHVEAPVFFVFSDDIEWCKKNLPIKNAVYVETERGNGDYVDMKLMSECKHHIITNSSFSWWSAWLSEERGITVCPKIWHAEYPGHHPCPNDWVRT